MSRHTLYLSLISVAIMSCSGVNNKRAEGSFDYLDQKPGKPLVIPSGLDAPNYAENFKISSNINTSGAVGENLDVRAPALVLPIAASSRIDLKNPSTAVWFDTVFEDRDLEEFIVYAIKENLKKDNVELIKNPDGTYESSWILKENVIDRVLYETIDSIESMRFKYTFDVKSHRRSLALHVDLMDYMKTSDDGGTKVIAPIDQKREEVNMLNEIITQVDYEYRLQQQKDRLAKAAQDMVIVGINNENEPAYIVEMDLDILWDSLPIFFSEYGFEISDLNESKYIYYVDFETPEVSFWDAIWGEDVEAIDVKHAKYQFQVTRMDNQKSAVTIYHENGDVLSEETLERIAPVMKKGLSFRKLF